MIYLILVLETTGSSTSCSEGGEKYSRGWGEGGDLLGPLRGIFRDECSELRLGGGAGGIRGTTRDGINTGYGRACKSGI